MRSNLSMSFFIITLILAIFAEIIGLGYGLYIWSTGVSFATAAWIGFKLWGFSMIGAIICLIFSIRLYK